MAWRWKLDKRSCVWFTMWSVSFFCPIVVLLHCGVALCAHRFKQGLWICNVLTIIHVAKLLQLYFVSNGIQKKSKCMLEIMQETLHFQMYILLLLAYILCYNTVFPLHLNIPLYPREPLAFAHDREKKHSERYRTAFQPAWRESGSNQLYRNLPAKWTWSAT